jgi:hypothetical protein
MYPNRIPHQVQDDPRLAGERRVYEAMRDGLDDDCAVLFRVPFRVEGGDAARPRDGEADFIVCDPRAGLLMLEVKGGRRLAARRDRTNQPGRVRTTVSCRVTKPSTRSGEAHPAIL